MWRDQVNYFTRQIIKCFFFFLWAGARRGRIYAGSSSDIHKKIFLKLILCQNVFFKHSTHAMYLKQKLIRTYFHMWLCILPLRGQTWFLFFGIGHQPNSVTTVLFTLWSCILILKEPLYCRGRISVCFPVLLLPDVVLYCPLLSENHPLAY